jgi:cupin 2 domain-containing protein
MAPCGCRRARGGSAVNLLFPVPDARIAECVDELLARPGLRIERIVSHGQASPPGFWYDQAEGEWLLLLAGAARLQFADEGEARLLEPGDCLDIVPHRRHRVDWTDPANPTVWLAVFYWAEV